MSRLQNSSISFIFFGKPVDKIPNLCYYSKSIYTLYRRNYHEENQNPELQKPGSIR